MGASCFNVPILCFVSVFIGNSSTDLSCARLATRHCCCFSIGPGARAIQSDWRGEDAPLLQSTKHPGAWLCTACRWRLPKERGGAAAMRCKVKQQFTPGLLAEF